MKSCDSLKEIERVDIYTEWSRYYFEQPDRNIFHQSVLLIDGSVLQCSSALREMSNFGFKIGLHGYMLFL